MNKKKTFECGGFIYKVGLHNKIYKYNKTFDEWVIACPPEKVRQWASEQIENNLLA